MLISVTVTRVMNGSYPKTMSRRLGLTAPTLRLRIRGTFHTREEQRPSREFPSTSTLSDTP